MNILKESWAIAIRDFKKDQSIVKYILTFVLFVFIIILIGEGLNSIVTLKNQSYKSFFTPSILAYFIAIGSLSVGSELIIDKKGFMRLLMVAPVSRISILFGKVIFMLLSILRFYFFISIIFMIYIGVFTITRLLFTTLTFIIITLLFTGIGFLVSTLFNKLKTAQHFVGYFSMASLFLSGIIYPIQSMPVFIRYLAYINPMTYAAELIRYTVTGIYTLPLILTFFITITLSIIFPTFGVYFYEKRLRK